MKISEDRMQLDLAHTHISKLKEQLRLCNIDQLNAEQELTKLREEIGELKNYVETRMNRADHNFLEGKTPEEKEYAMGYSSAMNDIRRFLLFVKNY